MSTSKIEDRIRKLFERATSDTKGDERAEAEADTALALAQKLAAQHSIDLEVLRQQSKARGEEAVRPTKKRLFLVEGPYIRHRANLASRIALSMGLKTLLANNGRFIEIIGFAEDIDMAWQIFGLVEPQMMNSADHRVKRGEHKQVIDYARQQHISAKTYKSNYFTAYVNRVARRIELSRREAEEGAVFAEGTRQEDGSTTGRVTGELVLASRKAEVDRYFEELHPMPKYKNGKPKKTAYWKVPTSASRVDAARLAGAKDGERARIRFDREVGRPASALR